MVDGITLHTANHTHTPPDYVMQVATMVRALSNKYVPVPSLDKVEVNLLLSLRDFCHHARKRTAQVHL
jgi:hypothetical protein